MVSIEHAFPKSEAPIYVIGDEGSDGFFTITSNNSPVALGDLKASTAEDFFSAVDIALQEHAPERPVVVLFSDKTGDVQERTYARLNHQAA